MHCNNMSTKWNLCKVKEGKKNSIFCAAKFVQSISWVIYSTTTRNFSTTLHYICLRWWGVGEIELYQYTYWRKRKCEQLHYKLYFDFMLAALCLVFRCKLLISCRHFSYVWLPFWLLSSLPVGSYGFIEACVLFWQSCKKKKRCWEIEVGNMNPKNNNMKCSTADWPIVNLTAGAPRCVYITFRLSGCSRSLTKKGRKS